MFQVGARLTDIGCWKCSPKILLKQFDVNNFWSKIYLPKKIGEEIDSQNKVLDKKYLVKKMLGEIILGSNNLFGQKNIC